MCGKNGSEDESLSFIQSNGGPLFSEESTSARMIEWRQESCGGGGELKMRVGEVREEDAIIFDGPAQVHRVLKSSPLPSSAEPHPYPDFTFFL